MRDYWNAVNLVRFATPCTRKGVRHGSETRRQSRRRHRGIQRHRRCDRQATGRRRRIRRRQLQLQQGRGGQGRRRNQKAGGKAIAVQANVAKPAEIEQLFAETKKAFDKLDILVNNAGVYEFRRSKTSRPNISTNSSTSTCSGLLLATQEAVKQIGPAGGSIINISSVAATAAPATGSVYSGTKAAVDAVTRALAKELGPRKIRVNAINPGMVETEGFHAAGIADSDFRKQIEAQTPLGRIGQPNDIAPAAVFLASADSSWITGETLFISGGLR